MTTYSLLVFLVFILQFEFVLSRRRPCDCDGVPEDYSVEIRGVAPAVRCWVVVRGETYIIRSAKPPTQDEVAETLLGWAQDNRTNMTLADAEDVLDYMENRLAMARRNRHGCEDREAQ